MWTCTHALTCFNTPVCRLWENPWAARAWESGPAGDAGRGGHEGFTGGLPGGEEAEGSQWWTAGELRPGGQETFNRSIPDALGLRRHKHAFTERHNTLTESFTIKLLIYSSSCRYKLSETCYRLWKTKGSLFHTIKLQGQQEGQKAPLNHDWCEVLLGFHIKVSFLS